MVKKQLGRNGYNMCDIPATRQRKVRDVNCYTDKIPTRHQSNGREGFMCVTLPALKRVNTYLGMERERK